MKSNKSHKNTAALIASATLFAGSGAVAGATTVAESTPAVESTESSPEPSPSNTPTQSAAAPVFTAVDAIIPEAEEGSVVNVPLVTGADSTSITVGQLPPGVQITDGALTGTPTTAGDYSFTVKATNPGGDTEHGYTWKITPKTPVFIDTDSLIPQVEVGTPVNHPLVTGADETTVISGALPAGITLVNGALSGEPSAAGTFHFTVKATHLDKSATKDFSWEVTPLATPTPTETATPSPTASTETPTAEPTPSVSSQTATPSAEPTPSASHSTETATPTPSPSETATPSASPSGTATPSATPSASESPTSSPSATLSNRSLHASQTITGTGVVGQFAQITGTDPDLVGTTIAQCRFIGPGSAYITLGGYNVDSATGQILGPKEFGPDSERAYRIPGSVTPGDYASLACWAPPSGPMATGAITVFSNPAGLSPSLGPSGTTTTITGTLTKTAGTTVTCKLDGVDLSPTGSTDADGNFSITTAINGAKGPHEIVCSDGTISTSPATFTITASSVTLNPTHGLSGDSTLITGGGLSTTPGTTVTCKLDGVDLSPTTTTNSSGNFSLTAAITGTPGAHEISCTDGTVVTAPATYTIDASPDPVVTTATAVTGGKTQISGKNFTPGYTVRCMVGGGDSGLDLGSAVVGSNREFSFESVDVTLPESPTPYTMQCSEMGVWPSITGTGDLYVVSATTPIIQEATDVSKTTATFTGTCTAGNNIELFMEGSTTGISRTCGQNGKFSIPFTSSSVADTTKQFTVKDTVTSETSPPISVTFSDQPAPAPVWPSGNIVTATQAQIGQPYPGFSVKSALTGAQSFSISGTDQLLLEAHNLTFNPATGQISIKDNTKPVLGPVENLNIEVTAYAGPNQTGNSSTGNVSLKVSSEAPATKPTVVVPTGEVTPGQVAVLTGTATPGATVNVMVAGTVVGQTTAGTNGQWSFAYTVPGSAAGQSLIVTVKDMSSGLVSGPKTLKVKAQTPGTKPTVVVPTGEVTAGNSVTLTGTATPGATVNVMVDGTVVGQATAGPDGKWSFAYTVPAGAAGKSLVVTVKDMTSGLTSSPGTIHVAASPTPGPTPPGPNPGPSPNPGPGPNPEPGPNPNQNPGPNPGPGPDPQPIPPIPTGDNSIVIPTGVSGDPVNWIVAPAGATGCSVVAGSLPPGVTLVGCDLVGVPTVAGNYSFSIEYTTADGVTETRHFEWEISTVPSEESGAQSAAPSQNVFTSPQAPENPLNIPVAERNVASENPFTTETNSHTSGSTSTTAKSDNDLASTGMSDQTKAALGVAGIATLAGTATVMVARRNKKA